ncbi:MAG: penicillin-binding transpeptidase domain-containing protein, partial [Bacteroidota bacterium]|nr:penicillin-binding transpeptidase domain-containing protein [Bacteroidota bacterium]
IELQFDADLAGKPGFIVYQRDANGRRRPEVDYPQREPVNGRSVVLTIDQAYQSIAEEELQRGVQNAAARSGRCVILQPRTGEILALANVPSIDPNDLSSYTSNEIANAKNRVVTDVYEPGSTFKLVAMSAALNEGLVKPDDVLDGNNGCWEYAPGQKPIRDEHGFGRISLRDAFIYSSNIISAKLAERLGAERFYTYARNFGFGLRTGIELPGEVRGELRKPTAWDGSTLKYLAFGYGLSATSLQIACAYAAIANDGVLMQPFIRRWLLDEDRNIIEETTPQVIRRVVSSGTAATMRDFMRGVVERGTATAAAIPGVDIAGKTGTSQRLVGDRYSSTSHVASFVGFFPASDPKILILVLLEEPKNGYYGGVVAAPVFRNIALRIITSRPEFAPPARPVPEWIDTVRVPDLCGLHQEVAVVLARAYGLEVRTRGNGDVVCRQNPAPGNRSRRRETVTLDLASAERGTPLVRVPDVTGIPVRRAAARLAASGLHASIAGSGVVFSQLPAAGELLEHGAPCTLLAEPRRGSPVHVY